ncbi:MAG TPA: pteridine reductase [Xanthomonadales bacterium]|nr:pteridine reductase [Xanthomonadales bacterium]
MKSSHKTAVVTGSAARIGASIAENLHARGCEVLLHCNANLEGANALAEKLNGQRAGSASVVSADLCSQSGIDRLVEACNERWNGLDLLVNNASRFYPTTVGETTAWQWDDLLNSNLRAPYFLGQGLLTLLRKAEGCIINILDIHASRPMKQHGVYSIAKAGLQMLTLSLARELAPAVRVNGVAPGAILWPENEGDETTHAAILGRVALGRLGQPQDIAAAVTFLAFDAPYVTGQVLAVDGGRSLNM